MQQLTLFVFRKPRRLMHVWDYGDDVAYFRCRCGYESGWIPTGKLHEDKRGRPCPRCNPFEADGGASS
jgi:hypothetical protein